MAETNYEDNDVPFREFKKFPEWVFWTILAVFVVVGIFSMVY